jgi:tetratricopeptide (TPR) repeat protein
MKAPLYDDILKLCQTMANASANENEKARIEAHKALQKLCQSNADTPKDHPLQWEALADFTDDGDQAIDIYQLALNSAEKRSLMASQASIHLAIAQRYVEFEETEKAIEYITNAYDLLKHVESAELKTEITELFEKLKA